MSGATEDQRNALAHLVAAGGTINMHKVESGSWLGGCDDVRTWKLYGASVKDLFDRGLVYVTDHGHNITITSLGRALAKERP